jgi:ABC-type nickel/cobalt efflux system permease component RcnA
MDAWLADLMDGAPLLVALGIAFALGLRHASDPDHLVAVTTVVAADRGDVRGAAGLGAWWGAGHAATLVTIGLPVIVLKQHVPRGLERAAETAIGVVILALAARVIVVWWRGEQPRRARTRRQAFGIGMLHGLAGTGAVVVLLIAALPGRLEAAAALALFAPMSIVSMTACTSAFAWVLARPAIAPVYRTVLMPAMGAFGLLFGLWYAGIT